MSGAGPQESAFSSRILTQGLELWDGLEDSHLFGRDDLFPKMNELFRTRFENGGNKEEGAQSSFKSPYFLAHPPNSLSLIHI